jgi:hypothetical protein
MDNLFDEAFDKLRLELSIKKLTPEEIKEKEKKEKEEAGSENPKCIIASDGENSFIVDVLNRDKAYFWVVSSLDDYDSHQQDFELEKGVYLVEVGEEGEFDHWGEYDSWLILENVKKIDFKDQINGK